MNLETHSLADWVRLRGGIKISEITHDDTEIRAVCSPKEMGRRGMPPGILNQKTGKSLDDLASKYIEEWGRSYETGHDDFLADLQRDIVARRNGDLLRRVWPPWFDVDSQIDKLLAEEPEPDFDDWADWCGDCCSSCGLSPEEARRIGKPEPDEVWLRIPATDPHSEWIVDDWHDILCDECCNMIVKVMP